MTDVEVRAAITRCIEMLVESEPSKAAFARKVGTTPQSVTQWTNGTKIPALEMLVHIADVYGVSMDVMFGRNGVPDGLAANEREVLALMREMNAHGRKMVLTMVQVFKASGSYDQE